MIRTQHFRRPLDYDAPRRQRLAAVFVLLLALTLQCFQARAELLFRGVEQVNGVEHWSPIRKYANPADTAYSRTAAGGGALPPEEVHVFLSGEITRADLDSAAVMERLLRTGRQKLAGNAVWLASNGGDIDVGMDLGRLLRNLGIFTLVGRKDQCLSACVFAFMGGERRAVVGRLGIHRPYFPSTQDSPDRPARFRHLQKTVRDYIEEMDFPPSLYESMMLVPPESMQILSAAELKRFYLEGISPLSEDLADAASARRLKISMYDYLKRKAASPGCAFLIAGQGICEDRALEAAANRSAADYPGPIRKAGSALPGGVLRQGMAGTPGS